MTLNKVDREKVNDSRLKLQSVSRVLRGVKPDRIPDYDEIEDCLEDAEASLRRALRESEQ